MSYWIKWSELNNKINNLNRSVVFYGRSEDWIPKAIKKINYKKSKLTICDNNRNFDNTVFHEINVRHINFFKKNIKKFFFVITTSRYQLVIKDLIKNKLQAGIDFVCLPDFYDFANLVKMRSSKGTILFSSPDDTIKKATRYSSRGGGLFLLRFSENETKIEKIYNGTFRQIVKNKNFYYCAEHTEGNVYVLDKKFKLKKIHKLKINSLCGIDYCPDRELLFCVSSITDIVYIYSLKKKKL
jgi:hypothetical protein